jgi:hypothetical protein
VRLCIWPKQSLGVEGIEVKRGETKKVELTFERPGRIQVKTIVDGKPSDQVDVELYRNDKLSGVLRRSKVSAVYSR